MSGPYTFTTEDIKLLHQWLQQGVSGIEMANRLGRSENTVKCVLRRLRSGGYAQELAKAAFQDQVNAEKVKLTSINYNSDVTIVTNKDISNTPVSLNGIIPETIRPPIVRGSVAPEPDVHGRYVSDRLPDCVLVLPDMQAPFQSPDCLAFLSMVAQRYQPDCVVSIGDEVDLSFASSFDKVPEIDEPIRELEAAINFMQELFKLFPKAYGLTSNHVHGRLENLRRRGRIPAQMMVPFDMLVGAPKGWQWYEQVILGDVLFRHGDKRPKLNTNHIAKAIPRDYGRHYSVVHGHWHQEHGRVGDAVLVGDDEYWAAYTGTLINPRAKAFGYGPDEKVRLGCLVIVNGTPHRIPMRRDVLGRWTGKL